MNDELAFVDQYVPGIRWDAKYATWDNFTGKPVDGYIVNRIVGTRAMCDALAVVRDVAAARGYGVLLWDAYRPQRAVDAFLRWSQEPEDGTTKQRFYPNHRRSELFQLGYIAAKSGHTRGSAVDLTIYDLKNGDLLPMGGNHDLLDPISSHGASGITEDETRNREVLRTIMEACGFDSYDVEWWHYSLKDEPFPDTFFDDPIA